MHGSEIAGRRMVLNRSRTTRHEEQDEEDHPGKRCERSEGDEGQACVVVAIVADGGIGVKQAGVEDADEPATGSKEHDSDDGHNH
jgi:hypothetical protein